MHSATGHALLRIMYTPSNINVTTTTLYSLRSLSPNVVNHHAAVLDPAKYGYCLVVAPTLQAQAVDGHNFVTWEGREGIMIASLPTHYYIGLGRFVSLCCLFSHAARFR